MLQVFREQSKLINNSLGKIAEVSNPRKYHNNELDIEVDKLRELIEEYIDTAYNVQSWNDGGR